MKKAFKYVLPLIFATAGSTACGQINCGTPMTKDLLPILILEVNQKQIIADSSSIELFQQLDRKWVKSIDMISDYSPGDIFTKRESKDLIFIDLKRESLKEMPRKMKRLFRRSEFTRPET